LYKLVDNEPAKIESLKAQAQAGSINIQYAYEDNIISIMCNSLENLNVEVQAYYDIWSREKNLVEIMKAQKEQVEVTIYFLNFKFSMFTFFCLCFENIHIHIYDFYIVI